jgi:hypothetical protein
MEDAEIGYEWMAAYATISRRCRDNKDFGFSRYPYEQGPGVGPFNGGYFEQILRTQRVASPSGNGAA